MGHYENIVKIEEMRKKMHEQDILSAQKILDTIDIKKIKNMSDLNLIAEVYAENERYDEAAELYLKIYEKTKSRKSLFRLVDLSIKGNKTEDAQYYLSQYQKIAPKDFYRYIFRYQIDKLKGEPYETLIDTLESLKNTEYLEQWAYELAKTYYKAGMEKECIRECSDIILWFGEGVYVEKAKILRAYYSGDSSVLEELKRRSMESSGKNSQEDNSLEKNMEEEAIPEAPEMEAASTYTQKQILPEEAVKHPVENKSMESGNAVGYKEEFEEEDFAANLKNDVQNILTEDVETNRNNETEGANQMPEEERAEKEFEKTINQLLKEEELNEEDTKLKRMSEEFRFDLEEIFGNFLHVNTIKKQLANSLEIILDEHTRAVQMIITGTEGSGKTTLAKDFTLFLNKIGKLKSSKIAKIKAEKLNAIDLKSKAETLRDCCLVVEEASDLKRKTIEGLLDLSLKMQGDMAIIFEENKKNMDKLFREYPKLIDQFKNRIHLPRYTQDELLGFAYACFKQKNYRLNPKADIILKSKISHIIEQAEQKQQLNQIDILTQSAMNCADIRSGRNVYEFTSEEHLRDTGDIPVLPEDFEATL